METWYECAQWTIDPVRVEKHTAKFVWIDGRKALRLGRFSHIFPTWDEAHKYQLARATQKLSDCMDRAETLRRLIEDLQSMKNPTEEPTP